MTGSRRATSHRHCCVSCRATYLDNCAVRGENDECNSCRSGHPSRYATGLTPGACCPTRVRPVISADVKTYRLAGDGTWWICTHCHRTFGYHPGDPGGTE